MRYVYQYFDPKKYHFTILAPNLPELKILLNDMKMLCVECIPISENSSTRDFFLAVSKEIFKQKYDLIHSHGFTSGLSIVAASRLKRTPHLMTSHDVFNNTQFLGLAGQVKKIVLFILFPMIDMIHSVSQDAQDNLLKYVGIMRKFPNKLIVIPNGIEVCRFVEAEKKDFRKELNLPDETFLIGFLGRFMSQKGFKYLVEALELMLCVQNLPKKPLVLAFGEGGFIREEKRLINEKGLNNSVFFMPFESNIAPVLKGLDVLAMPSLWEACPLQPMEALTAGTPVIGSDCIGLREVLKDTPARIVPRENSKELADALIEEMNSPLTEGIKKFSAEAAKRYDVKKKAKELERLILSLMR